MKQPKTVEFKFNHICNIKGATGRPGQVVAIDAALAQALVSRGGGVIVDGGDEVAPADSPSVESAAVAAPQSATLRTKAPEPRSTFK